MKSAESCIRYVLMGSSGRFYDGIHLGGTKILTKALLLTSKSEAKRSRSGTERVRKVKVTMTLGD